MFRIHHDEDAETTSTASLAGKVVGYTSDYVEVPLRICRRSLSRPDEDYRNPLERNRGGQYIDVGLVEIVEKR